MKPSADVRNARDAKIDELQANSVFATWSSRKGIYKLRRVLIALGWFTEHGQPFDARATGFHSRLRHFVDSRVPES